MKNQAQPKATTAILLATIAILCIFSIQSAVAGTKTWNGGATPDGNWTTPGNWNGVAPATNDLLVFSGGTQTATTNNFATGVPFNNISFSSGAGAFTLNGNPITISSPTDAGSGLITGGSISSFSANAQTIRSPILFASGNHTITNGGAGVLKLNGTITHSNGAALVMSGNINAAGGLSTNGNLNGILGGWAVFGTNYATLDAVSNVIGFVNYTFVSPGGNIVSNPASNVKISTAGSAILVTNPVTAINSLVVAGTTAAQTITMNSNKLVLGQNGGIFNITGLGGTVRALNIGANDGSRGTITAGDGINPAQITFAGAPLPSASGMLTIQSAITDNGSAPVTVVLAGAYISLNGAAAGPTNTYSGGTYILQGRISQPTENTFGSGPIFIVSGGQANPGKATGTGVNITNDFYIEGSGTVENQGMGALRMFGNGGVTIGAVTTGTKLTGKITLTGNAAVCANGDTTGGIGIGGKITGPGGFILGSPTFAANNNNGAGGCLTVGDVAGLAIPNDYAGDTVINGSASSATQTANNAGATLRIFTAADNNIMPHGATGSYAGGKTGNLILKGTATTATTHAASFDLNGSTQTINGLATAGTSLTNNFVASSNAPGLLILGDNNASATFAGTVQDGAGLSLTKIGTGTQNLTGTNTYTGATIVKAGKLGTTTSSAGGGNYSVSNSAALGVTTATAGGTLQVNNLTLDSSSALQLNVGTNGNPSAPIVHVNGTLTLNGAVTVSIAGPSLTPGTFQVLTYNPGNVAGAGSFTMVNSPRVVGTLTNDTSAGIVSVTVTSVDTAIKWNGGGAGNWDINNAANTIWQTIPSAASAFYIESGSGNDAVRFDDSATGVTSVNLSTTLTPLSTTVSNSSKSYIFTGSGKITGDTGLTKLGNGTLTIANSGNNDFAGDIALSAGTLVISNDSTIPNTISGGGTLVKIGDTTTLTLSGNNPSYTGPVAISAGTLKVLNGAALATATATTISNGAVLDIGLNSVDMGTSTIIAVGSGIGGNGAIINSSGNGGFLVSNFKNLTLAGNTTVGGPGRLDLRATDANNGTDATLSTGGNGYKLTKVSSSQFQVAGAQIDSALGDIDVQGGTFGIQGQVNTLGNPNNFLTVFGGATLQLFAVANVLNKSVVLKDSATINSANSDNTFGGPIALQGNGLFNVSAASLTLTNVISGTGTLSKVTGAFPLNLGAANSYSGGTVANAGLITFSADNNLGAVPGSPTPANIILNGGGISATADGAINSNRGIAVGPSTGAGAGFIDVATSSLLYNGVIANNGSGVGTLIKTNSGTLYLGGASTYTGPTIVVGGTLALTNNGSIGSSSRIILSGTTLDASFRADGGLTLAPGQILTGYGNITGNLTNGPGATINPGSNQIANFTVTSGTVKFLGGGTNVMNIDRDASQYDTINATNIVYGGTLSVLVSNANNFLADGDAFPLFSATTYSGVFASIVPAAPAPGLAWNTNTLATDGNLRIVTAPAGPTTNANITKVTLQGTNMIVHGTNNNVPNTSFHYAVLTATNILTPLSNWTPVVTNPFNPDGTFDYTNPIVPGTPRQFIDVQAVP